MSSIFSKEKLIYWCLWIIFLVIFFPLFKYWYFFSLDFSFNPNGWIPKFGDHIYWVWILSIIFTKLWISITFLEKIVFFIAIFFPLLWIYLLNKKIDNKYALFFSLLFIIVNPFFYARFLDWQINVLLSLSFFPIFIYYLKEFFEKLDYKNIIITAILSLLLCLTSIHNIVFIFFIWIIFFLVYLQKNINYFKKIFFLWFLISLFNLFWITPTLILKNNNFELFNEIQNFDNSHIKAFATNPWEIWIYKNVLSLHWYWWEWQKRFFSSYADNKKYFYIFMFIFLLVLIWIFERLYKNKNTKKFEISLFILMITAYIFALGESNNNIFYYINKSMYDYFPFYTWFREPHKWIIFLLIWYVYFWSFWVKYIYDKIWDKITAKKIALVFLCILPIFYSPSFLFWFSNQIKIKNYPKEWKEIKSIINNDNVNNCSYIKEQKTTKCYNTLFFPRHLYIWINWIWKIVWWWIVQYFWDNLLFWDNLEIDNIYTSSTRRESKIIEGYIWPNWLFKWDYSDKNVKNFINDLDWLWISYIILLKEADFDIYREFLDKIVKKWYLKIEKENKMIKLYKVIY